MSARRSLSYRRALAGLKRCDKPAAWIAMNGYAVCPACFALHRAEVPYDHQWESCEGEGRKCDRKRDGMGAASWPKRLAAAERAK